MTTVTNYINNEYRPINSKESILDVRDFFEDKNFSHFPVIQDNTYIGSFSKEDLENFDPDKTVADYLYSLEGFLVRENQNWMEILESFAKNNTNLIPVLDQDQKYLGYYELESIIGFFNQTPFLKEQGSIIVIKKAVFDYSIGQITQIVEGNNGKLLGVFISNSDNFDVEITVKIAVGEMNNIIQSFRRYGYEIISNHQEDNFINILKDRSEYLEKYLSI